MTYYSKEMNEIMGELTLLRAVNKINNDKIKSLEEDINIHKNRIEMLRKIISDKGIKSSNVCLDDKSTIL